MSEFVINTLRGGKILAWRQTVDPELVNIVVVSSQNHSAIVALTRQQVMELSMKLLELYVESEPDGV